MRIAIVTESFYPAVDGTTRTVQAVVDRLVDTGHDVLVVAPAPGLADYRGCRVARIRTLEKPGRQVREALAGFRPDLVHVTSPGAVGRRALRHAQRLGVPSLVVQQSVVAALDAERWARKVAARADRVLVTCDWMAEQLSLLGTEDAEVWLPGVDHRAFAPQLRDDHLHGRWSRARSKGGPQVVVGYVGSLHKRNGVRRLADVAGVPGVRLVVVGDGAQRGWIQRQVPTARLLGPLQTGELATALASLDVLVHPGRLETDAHVLREAAASGVPVVASAAGGHLDAVEDGVTGLLARPDEPTALPRAVAALAGDPALRTRMGEAARYRATRRDWADAVDELLAVHYPAVLAPYGRAFAA